MLHFTNLRLIMNTFMLKLATFGTSYELKTTNKSITCWVKIALRYFDPNLSNRLVKMIDNLVFLQFQPYFAKYFKYSRLVYGDLSGQCAVKMKWGTSRVECNDAESYWNFYGQQPKCLCAQDLGIPFEIFSQ